MPRQPVSSVQEHRVTLGDYERRELSEFLKSQARDEDLELVFDAVKALAMPLSLVAVGYLGYLGLTYFSTALDPLQDAASAAASASGLDAFVAGLDLGEDGAAGLTPEQAQAFAAAQLNPLARGLAGYGLYGGFLRRVFG